MERGFESCLELSENYTHCVEVRRVPQNVGVTVMKRMPRAAYKRMVSANSVTERTLICTHNER